MEILDEIEEGFTSGEIEGPIKKLKEILIISEEELYTESLLILVRYNILQSEVRQGIIESEKAEIKHIKIVRSAIELLNEIRKDESILEKYFNTKIGIEESNKGKEILYDKVAGNSLLRRISIFKENNTKRDLKVLRIAKNPTRFDKYEGEIIKSLGAEILYATTSTESEIKIMNEEIDVIISSVQREGNPQEGFDFHAKLVNQGVDIPFIFYVGYADPGRGVPPYAFGITHKPNELIHLLIDALERK